jgi:Ni/Fe-hydrogenase subunit HybB-like protein
MARIKDPKLRITLIATALLIVPQVGQFVTMHDLNTTGHNSGISILFMMALVFLVPTSIILSGTVIYITRKAWRTSENRRVVALAALNIVLALSIVWFFFSPCSWAEAFALTMKACKR